VRRTLLLLSTLASLAAPSVTVAAIINFDDLPTTQTWESVPNAWDDVPAAYGGLTWSGWEVINRAAYQSIYGDATPFPSNPNAAYPGFDTPSLTVSSSVPFEFQGAMLAGWYGIGSSSASSVTITGYLGGEFVWQLVTVVSPAAWTSSGGHAGAVDQLVFTTSGPNTYFRMDDFAYDIPEPATLGLAALVLAAFAGLVRLRML
jgi:hypothetical protein